MQWFRDEVSIIGAPKKPHFWLFSPSVAVAVASSPLRLGEHPESFGPFRLFARVGEGRRSIVYAGDSGEGTALLALRVLRSNTDAAQFEAIVRTHALRAGGPPAQSTYVDDRLTFFDPLIIGESLATVSALARPAPIPLDVAINVGLGIIDALRTPDACMVHGDLIPRHVLVGFDGSIYLRDPCGTDAPVPPEPSIAGRTPYLAPEQLAGETSSARADVFALGVLLFELTTGVPLLTGVSDTERRRRLSAGEIPRPRDVVGDRYPLDLQLILRRMLRPEPTARFPNVADAYDPLRRAAQGLGRAGRGVIGAWMSSFAGERQKAWDDALDYAPQDIDATQRGPSIWAEPVIQAAIRTTPDPNQKTLQANIHQIRTRTNAIPAAATVPTGAPTDALEQDTQDNLLAASLEEPQPTERHPAVGESMTHQAEAAPPEADTSVDHIAADVLDSHATTSLDEIEEVGFGPPQPMRALVPEELLQPDNADTATGPGPVPAPAEPAVIPIGFSDTGEIAPAEGMNDRSATALLSRSDLPARENNFEIVPGDRASAEEAPSMQPPLVAEPPPLVPQSKQANIATYVVRERVIDSPPQAVVRERPGRKTKPARERSSVRHGHRPILPIIAGRPETRPSVSEVNVPLVVPIPDEDAALNARPIPWMFIAAAIASMMLLAAVVVTAVRFTLTTAVPAPLSSAPIAVPTRTQVRVSVQPASATLLADGRTIISGAVIDVEDAPVTIDASFPGFVPQTMTLAPGQTDDIIIRLQPVPPR